MQSFVRHTGTTLSYLRDNIDTDRIIPKQFLKRVERTGYGDVLFYDERYHADGTLNPSSPFNHDAAKASTILLAGRNFGCGSSREHAIWALMDYGFRAVIAPSFADIFANNAFQNGLVTVTLLPEQIEQLQLTADANPHSAITVDLQNQTISCGALALAFEYNSFRRTCLMQGLDEIGRTLQLTTQIAAFERARPRWASLIESPSGPLH